MTLSLPWPSCSDREWFTKGNHSSISFHGSSWWMGTVTTPRFELLHFTAVFSACVRGIARLLSTAMIRECCVALLFTICGLVYLVLD